LLPWAVASQISATDQIGAAETSLADAA